MRDELLRDLLTNGRRRWESIEIDEAAFEACLEERGWSDAPPPNPDDLYLACALSLGNEQACARVEREFFSALRSAIARVDSNEGFVDEVLQELRAKVLAGERPRIAQYTGRGPLGAWLRVAATRLALEQTRARGRRKEQPLDFDERAPAAASNPEQRLFREKYRAALEEAIATALAELGARDRNILRMHFVSGLNIDAIGKAYGVHRATVARWIARARGVLLDRTRTLVTSGSDAMSESDFESIVELVRSELDLHVSSVLMTDALAEPATGEARSRGN